MPKPFICMAPLADVTDAAFRQMFARYGCPDITWTEFVSADGLFLRPLDPSILPENNMQEIARTHGIGPDHPLLRDLVFTPAEQPIVAQFFSRDPERMYRAARLAADLGFAGIDINMGCPAAIICRQGAGSAMIKTPDLAKEIIQATIAGAGDLPVSVKTRIGYNKNEIETWLPALLASHPVAVILHARTKKDMSKVPAKWDVVSRAVEIRDDLAPDIKIVGNGDVGSLEEARQRIVETGADGAMVGRGLFGNPWFFNRDTKKQDLSLPEVLGVMLEHTKLFEDLLGDIKSFALMKKHFKAYLSGFEGVKEMRTALMNTNNYDEVQAIVKPFLL